MEGAFHQCGIIGCIKFPLSWIVLLHLHMDWIAVRPLRPYAHRSGRAQPPRTSAPRGGAVQALQPWQFHRDHWVGAAMVANVCSIFSLYTPFMRRYGAHRKLRNWRFLVPKILRNDRTIWIADAHQGDENRCLRKERERNAHPPALPLRRATLPPEASPPLDTLAAQLAPQHSHAEQSKTEQANCRARIRNRNRVERRSSISLAICVNRLGERKRRNDS